MIDQKLVQWLLEGPPWMVYRVRRDLLAQPEDHPSVYAARVAMCQDPSVQILVEELQGWPGMVLNNHVNAGQPIHKLAFLADLGLRLEDPGMDLVLGRVTAHTSPEGLFQVMLNVPAHFGGQGVNQWAWALCDAPLLLDSLIRMGWPEQPATERGISTLIELGRENSWPCASSPTLGSFRGPGRRGDPCPYATLVMLRLLRQLPEKWLDEVCHNGTETLLGLWEHSRDRHPYLFHMGTDFRKLKAPLVWFDLLHILDVLSCFPWVKADLRFREMIAVLKAKADAEGCFKAESVWMAWKSWEFGQKKVPSRWITFLALRILQKAEIDQAVGIRD
jgi:hypothetical protein